MPELNEIKSKVASFNSTYGLHFDIESFIRKSKGFTNGSTIKNFNKNYYKTVKQLADQFTEAKKNGNFIGTNTVCEMFDAFEEIIDDYRNECKKEDSQLYPAEHGGKSRVVYADYFQGLIDKMPTTIVDEVVEKYKRGEIRIRDMVAQARRLENNEAVLGAAQELAANVLALKKVNESRSALWRFFHPFRNNAEKREANYLEQTYFATQNTRLISVENVINGDQTKTVTTMSIDYKKVTETTRIKQYELDSLDVLRHSIQREAEDKEADRINREKIVQEIERDNNKKAFEEGYKALIDPKYRPNPSTLKKDEERIQAMDKAIKDGIITDEDAINTYTINKKIYGQARDYVQQNGADSYYSNLAKISEDWDKLHMGANNVEDIEDISEVDPDEVFKNFFKQSISVDLEPNAVNAGVSQFVEGKQIKIDNPVQHK